MIKNSDSHQSCQELSVEALLSNLPGMVYRCKNDIHFTMIFISQGVYGLIGYHPDQLIQNHEVSYSSCIHPEDISFVKKEIQKALDQKVKYCLEYRVIDVNKKVKWVWEQGNGIYNKSGSAECLEGCIMDITERKLSEQALHDSNNKYKNLYSMMRLMCDNVPDMIWAKDLNSKYIFTNRAMCENLLMAENTDEPTGKTDMFFAKRQRKLHPDNPDCHSFGEICRDSDTIVQNSKKPERFDEYGNVKGKFLFLDVHKAPFWNENGEMIGTVGCGRDVTNEKELIKECDVNHLQQKGLINELEIKNAELERFSYSISHELKAPLITIKGFLGLLKQDTEAGNMNEMLRDVEQISDAVGKMGDMLKQLLNITRVGLVSNPHVQLSFSKLVEEAAGLLHVRIKMHQVEIDVQPDIPDFTGDPLRMREVLMNLIDNAIQYMGDQKEPKITIGYKEHQGKGCYYVQDNGIGIDIIYLDKIFSLFERLNEQVEGCGIGLSIVKRIIIQHNGEIWAESEGLGKGTTFYFTIKV